MHGIFSVNSLMKTKSDCSLCPYFLVFLLQWPVLWTNRWVCMSSVICNCQHLHGILTESGTQQAYVLVLLHWWHVRGLATWARETDFLNHLNSIQSDIKLAMKTKSNDCLLLLDNDIYRTPDDSFGHSVYRKPTQTKSRHYLVNKYSVQPALAHRARAICDHYNLLGKMGIPP